jgi:excisionase family DNA binding protein
MGKKKTDREHAETVALVTCSDALYSVPEACATLGIGATKCWALISQGHLSVLRLGTRCTRIKKSSIDRLMQTGV